LKEEWTGVLIGKMHNADVTIEDLANEMGWVKGYVSMILNGHRKPSGAREKLESAFDSIVSRRNEGGGT
jgi:hypothetical protein